MTAITMVAFAGNSLLNRHALAGGEIGPSAFAAIRVAAGAVMLFILVTMRARTIPRPRRPDALAVAGLTAYMTGFSFAYVSMDAGIGALVLFGCVQITMFGGALSRGDRPPVQRWAGMALALVGLALLTWPSGNVGLNPAAVALMVGAAIGWGVYSLRGTRSGDPVAASFSNFLWSLPLVTAVALLLPDPIPAQLSGIVTAIVSGAITSALGYALWYAILPELGATRAALSQLSVPVIALLLGIILLGETVGPTAFAAASLITGGIALGLVRSRGAG